MLFPDPTSRGDMEEADKRIPTNGSGSAPAPLDFSIPITRRQLLRTAALGGTVLLLPGLAACVDDTPLQPQEQEFTGEVTPLSGTEPFLGEIRLMSFAFAPKGWALCNGQLLPINQNQALFALLGTTFGGDGRVNFALPDLRGRVPIHVGSGHILGERGGSTSQTLTMSEMPQHSHLLRASPTNANAPVPASNLLGGANNLYSPSLDRIFDPSVKDQIPFDAVPIPVAMFGGTSSLTTLSATTVTNSGGSQPHENRQPYLGLSFCIALQGIFPSSN